MVRFLSIILIFCSGIVFAQSSKQEPQLNYNYDRCEDHEFGGWNTISVRFQEEGSLEISLDDYVIKSQFANKKAYESEVDRIEEAGGSIMGKIDALANMYENTEFVSVGKYAKENGFLKIYLEDDEILGVDSLSCEISGRYLQCMDKNFVLANDEVIMDLDVISIENVIQKELTFNEAPMDRWIVHFVKGTPTLESGDNFQLESHYNRGQYLGHGRDGQLGLHTMDEPGISYEFRFYDSYGKGPIDALDDLKMKPAYFFGDYSYVVGTDQKPGNALISKQYKSEENLWYIEGAMCDIVDELAGNR